VAADRELSVFGGEEEKKRGLSRAGNSTCTESGFVLLLRHRCRTRWPRFAPTHFSRGIAVAV